MAVFQGCATGAVAAPEHAPAVLGAGAAAAPRRASFDPTEGDDVNDADLLPVTEGVIDGDEDLDEVTEIVGLTELVGVFEGEIDFVGESEFVGVTEIVGVTDAPDD